MVVVLATAGFSSRWNYYYDFGLQDLVFQTPLTTLPIYAIEVIRRPDNLVDLIGVAALLLVPFELLRVAGTLLADAFASRLARRPRTALIAATLRTLGARGGLTVDAIRAGLIVLVAFIVGGIAGTRDYRTNVVESTSRLPRVTAILPDQPGAKEATPHLPFPCDTRPLADRPSTPDPPFVGDPGMVRYMRGGGACSSEGRSWRLLFRDDKFVYLFATIPDYTGRPDTVVLPNSDALTLVMR